MLHYCECGLCCGCGFYCGCGLHCRFRRSVPRRALLYRSTLWTSTDAFPRRLSGTCSEGCDSWQQKKATFWRICKTWDFSVSIVLVCIDLITQGVSVTVFRLTQILLPFCRLLEVLVVVTHTHTHTHTHWKSCNHITLWGIECVIPAIC